VEPLA
jgi:hypothetical protein